MRRPDGRRIAVVADSILPVAGRFVRQPGPLRSRQLVPRKQVGGKGHFVQRLRGGSFRIVVGRLRVVLLRAHPETAARHQDKDDSCIRSDLDGAVFGVLRDLDLRDLLLAVPSGAQVVELPQAGGRVPSDRHKAMPPGVGDWDVLAGVETARSRPVGCMDGGARLRPTVPRQRV